MTMPPHRPPSRPPAQPGRYPGVARDLPPDSFSDRVMARVANEPQPSPGRVFLRSLRHLALRDAVAALLTAWRLAFEPTTSVSAATRASAAALFLSVVIIVGVGSSLLVGSGLAYLGSDGPTSPQLAPGASPAVAEPSPSPSPVPTPSPEATPVPTARPSEAAGVERQQPGPTAEPKQDRQERETPEPKERDDKEKSEKRETPEPEDRKREDKEDKEKGDD
jgi:outer membrane biosynthesis protein TonB